MKVQYLICITIYIIIIISGLNCEDEKDICKHENDECYKNDDCCSQNCTINLTSLKGNCSSVQNIITPVINNTNLSQNINEYIDGEEKLAKCAYYKQNNESLKKDLFKRFNLNAAHAILLPYTEIALHANNRFTVLTVNDNPPKNRKDKILYLSEEAAKNLSIVREGIFPCEIVIQELGNYKLFLYNYSFIIPIIGLFVILWQIKQTIL